ncbi:MAG: transglutaminase domain-containing protein [Verrucomicrobiales bacterium]
MPMTLRFPLWVVLISSLIHPIPARAITLEELHGDAKMNPKRFAKHFGHFKYLYNSAVQPPEQFLYTETGDCDDYATLADAVLREKGFTTRLIHVQMPGIVSHVVCYVEEQKGYLDYNNRANLNKLERSGPTLREIASKVAASFQANWTTATEFTYSQEGLKRQVAILVKTSGDQESSKVNSKVKVDF